MVSAASAAVLGAAAVAYAKPHAPRAITLSMSAAAPPQRRASLPPPTVTAGHAARRSALSARP